MEWIISDEGGSFKLVIKNHDFVETKVVFFLFKVEVGWSGRCLHRAIYVTGVRFLVRKCPWCLG